MGESVIHDLQSSLNNAGHCARGLFLGAEQLRRVEEIGSKESSRIGSVRQRSASVTSSSAMLSRWITSDIGFYGSSALIRCRKCRHTTKSSDVLWYCRPHGLQGLANICDAQTDQTPESLSRPLEEWLLFWSNEITHGRHVDGVTSKFQAAELPAILDRCQHEMVVVGNVRGTGRVVGVRNGDHHDNVSTNGSENYS